MLSTKHQYLQEAGPGLLFGSIHRFVELKQCLISDCDTWVLKFEQILIHGSYLLGYVSPRHVIWEMIKILLTRVSARFGNVLNRTELLMGFSLLEQLGLTYIWDVVRDHSICMRFNNCDADFLGQLSNIKMKTCNVENWMDDNRKLSTCERIFNDSPLIILAAFMLLLTILASGKMKNVTAINLPEQGSGTSSVNVNSTPASVLPPTHTQIWTANLSNDPPSNGLEESTSQSPTSGFPHQVIQAECPTCNRKFDLIVPNPWIMFSAEPCTRSCRASNRKCGKTAKFIKELFKDIDCNYCKEKLKKNLQTICSKKKKKQQETQSSKKCS